MDISKKTSLLVLTSALLAAGLCACDKSGGTPGEKLDRALDKTGETVKDAGEAIKPK
jgi:hypothetical protein